MIHRWLQISIEWVRYIDIHLFDDMGIYSQNGFSQKNTRSKNNTFYIIKQNHNLVSTLTYKLRENKLNNLLEKVLKKNIKPLDLAEKVKLKSEIDASYQYSANLQMQRISKCFVKIFQIYFQVFILIPNKKKIPSFIIFCN